MSEVDCWGKQLTSSVHHPFHNVNRRDGGGKSMRARIVQLTHQEQHLKERPWKSHLHIFDHKKMSQTHLICELKLDVDQTHLPVTSGNF